MKKTGVFVEQRMRGNLKTLVVLMQGFETQPANLQRTPEAVTLTFLHQPFVHVSCGKL